LIPYVLIGNPLTLTIIEFFAVPGALIGTALYPLGLDAPVWLYVGLGIKFILWAARHIAEAPGSTLHLRAFAPYALPFLSLAVASALIWRTWLMRATAIPFLVFGLIGAMTGPRYDVIAPADGQQAAIRDADGRINRHRQALQRLCRGAMAGRGWRRARGATGALARSALRSARLHGRPGAGPFPCGCRGSPRVRRGLRTGSHHRHASDGAGRLQGGPGARRAAARRDRRGRS
jgi:hypothetical protein